MAVTLPPALPPQPSVAASLQQQGAELAVFAFQGYQVHVMGAPVLAADKLTSARGGAGSLPELMQNLTARYFAAGYPAAQIHYAISGQDVYVHAMLGQITQVQGPDELKPYFESLYGVVPLTDSQLEPRRILASIHADRAGFEMSPVFQPDSLGGDRDLLDLQALPDSPDQTSLRAGFGNPGNRSVGRDFLDLDLRHSLSSGDEFSLSGRAALAGLGGAGGDEYHEETVGWNRVTTLGIFGLSGRNVDYGLDGVQRPVNGDMQQAEVDWLYPLVANFRSRLTVNLKADYTNKELSLQHGSDVLQKQEYGSAEAGTAYAYALELADESRVDIDAGLAIRKGMGDDRTDAPQTLADLGYLLFRPQAGVKVSVGPHWSARLDLSAQITDDIVPEQSQWLLGGIGNVSAYLPGVVAGDGGGLARLQLEYRNIDEFYGVGLTPRGFVEYGYATYSSNLGGLSNITPTIADAGAELALSVTQYLEASVIYAKKFYDKDIDHSVLDDAEANVYFRVTLKL